MIPAGGTFGGKHTYSYFGMIPKSKITFAPPTVKRTTVDVPEANGILDYTGLLTGQVAYGNRVGTIEFLVLTDNYATVYSQLLNHFHGKEMNVVLDDDPTYFYRGRFAVSKWKSKEGASTIAIDYDLEPYKYYIGSNQHTANLDWLWNDLFNTTIYYGSFAVSGTKQRNLINPSGTVVTPKFTCSNGMSVSFNGTTYQLPYGTTETPGFSLAVGNNVMTFSGNGNVLVDYVLGASL